MDLRQKAVLASGKSSFYMIGNCAAAGWRKRPQDLAQIQESSHNVCGPPQIFLAFGGESVMAQRIPVNMLPIREHGQAPPDSITVF